MGTGKTRIGKSLAHSLDMKFVDTDDVISERYNMSVSDIFAKFGEPEFRKAEEEVIAEVAAGDSQVIATGGGAVENPANMENLRRNGVVVCLTATPEVILSRTSAKDSRPMLRQGSDRMGRIQELLERRRCYYESADVQIDTSHNKPEVTIKAIIRYYKEHEDSQG